MKEKDKITFGLLDHLDIQDEKLNEADATQLFYRLICTCDDIENPKTKLRPALEKNKRKKMDISYEFDTKKIKINIEFQLTKTLKPIKAALTDDIIDTLTIGNNNATGGLIIKLCNQARHEKYDTKSIIILYQKEDKGTITANTTKDVAIKNIIDAIEYYKASSDNYFSKNIIGIILISDTDLIEYAHVVKNNKPKHSYANFIEFLENHNKNITKT